MKQEATQKTRHFTAFSRYAYFFFLLMVIFLLVKGDTEWATIIFGLSLAFDPFDQNVKWSNRPLYQRVWLIVHVLVLYAGFAFLLIK